MKRPVLNEVKLNSAKTCKLIITMSPGQWDALLDEGYKKGALLLEIDQNEQPVRAYQRLTEAEAQKVYPLSYKKKKGA